MSFLQIYNEQQFINDNQIDYPYIYQFPFPPDNFQKYGFQKIDKGDNILLTAHTGSGKTLMFIYSMMKHLKENGKIIYLSPIKSLSNEKYKEVSDLIKIENENNGTCYSVGILTGDIKINPLADVLIMTTEILRNALYKINDDKEVSNNTDFNFSDSVTCVVFDEVHYITDANRGSIWEESLILFNPSIQLIMLSATVDNAEEFANWIGNIKKKSIHLISTNHRVVPLEHYIYMNNKIYSIMNSQCNFNLENYNQSKYKYNMIQEEREKKHKKGTDLTVLNDLIKYLKDNDLLQTIIFSFSRINCEMYANMITESLVSEDEIIEIDKLFDTYMLKYNEQYNKINQYQVIRQLLRKGIAYHHSGLLPILKEIVEIIFSKGYVKILFATETFAVGINMPARTTVFTELEKFSDNGRRYLTPTEYIQMSGRAGRRGKDIKGNVIILPLYNFPNEFELKAILHGSKQKIKSKLIHDYSFELRIPLSSEKNIKSFINNSLFQIDNMKLVFGLEHELNNKQIKIEQLKQKIDSFPQEYHNLIQEYDKIENIRKSFENELGLKVNLNKKQLKEQQNLHFKINKIPDFKEKYNLYKNYNNEINEYNNLLKRIDDNSHVIQYTSQKMIQFLVETNYMSETALLKNSIEDITKNDITVKGILASAINECNPILLTEIIVNDLLLNLNPTEIMILLSIFIESNGEKNNVELPLCFDSSILSNNLKENIHFLKHDIIEKYMEIEQKYYIYNSEYWKINNDFILPTKLWAEKESLQKIFNKTNIYEGTFVRNMLKLNNIVQNVVNLCKIHGTIELLPILTEVENLIMRDIVSVNSLYI